MDMKLLAQKAKEARAKKRMKFALRETQKEFYSSSHRTQQYLDWHELFKREFSKFLTSRGITEIRISKPNHFDMDGFFRAGDGQIWYFSVGDLRWSGKETMLVRRAKSFEDYYGESNCFLNLKDVDAFVEEFERVVLGIKKD